MIASQIFHVWKQETTYLLETGGALSQIGCIVPLGTNVLSHVHMMHHSSYAFQQAVIYCGLNETETDHSGPSLYSNCEEGLTCILYIVRDSAYKKGGKKAKK